MAEAVCGGPALAGPPGGTVGPLVSTVPTDTSYLLVSFEGSSSFVCPSFFSAMSSCPMSIASSASVSSTLFRCLVSFASALLMSLRIMLLFMFPPSGVSKCSLLLHVPCQFRAMLRKSLSYKHLRALGTLACFLQYIALSAQLLSLFSYGGSGA